MKHAKKMIFVDFVPDQTENTLSHAKSSSSDYDVLKQSINKPVESGDSSGQSELDKEILKILHDSKLSDYEKVKFYNDLLRRFILKKQSLEETRKRNRSAEVAALANEINSQLKRKKLKVQRNLQTINETPPFKGFNISSAEKTGKLTKTLEEYRARRAVGESNSYARKIKTQLKQKTLNYGSSGDDDDDDADSTQTLVDEVSLDADAEEEESFQTPAASSPNTIRSWKALRNS